MLQAYNSNTLLGTAAVIANFRDGRQEFHVFMDSASYLTAPFAVANIWINWASHGLYVGSRRLFLQLQVSLETASFKLTLRFVACLRDVGR